MLKTMDEIKAALSEPFPASDVEWRLQRANKEKTRGFAVPYLRSRAIQARLDEVVGPYNWKAEYKPWHTVTSSNKATASQLCGLSIFCEERGEWVQKWDGAENTDIEPVKGGISDSFKRAAVLWGIGRYLYSLDGVWVELENEGKCIKKAELQRLDKQYEQATEKPASNVKPFPKQQNTPAAEASDFDYSVSAAEQREFQTGKGMALTLRSPDGNNVEAFLQRVDNMFATDPGTETIVGVAGISVLIALFAALVIYSIYYVSIIANVQELGKLRALGATKRQMRGLLLREGLLTAVVSLPIGLLLGYGVARVCLFVMMTQYWEGAGDVRVSLLSLPVILLVIALVLVTALLSLLRPMRQASRISPIEAIRYQEEGAGKRASRKGFGFMSVSRLSSANMSRNRRRTLVTVATMAVGGILFLTVSSVASSATYLDYVREGLLFKGDFSLNLLYEENDETYTENNLNSLQIAETLGDDMVKAIEAIPGVTKVEPQLSVLAEVHHPGYVERERYTIASFKKEDVPLYKLDLQQGALDYDAMVANNGVAFSWDHGMEEYGFKIGDPVKLTLFDGEREIPFEGTLAASFGAADGSFMIPEDLLKQYVTGTNPTGRLYVTVEGGVEGEAYPAVKMALQAIVGEDEHLALVSMDEELAIAKIGIDVIRTGAYIILGILGVVGLMNLVNTMIIGVVTRRREIGMLEAVGMSAKQLGSMLWREGLVFTGGTLALALTVGNLIGYLAFRWCVENGILGITHYHYPIIETLILAAALILAQLLITKLLARYVHKGSLVERIQV